MTFHLDCSAPPPIPTFSVDEALANLDAYEGHRADDPDKSLFTRRLLPVQSSDGSQVLCWIYLYDHSLADAQLIESGDYAAWLNAGKQRELD